MSESSKRSVTVRLDKEVHDRLHSLSQESGESITELVRSLVEHALDHDTTTEVLAQTQAIKQRLTALEQSVSLGLPALYQRLGTLEQLVCTADANAARRYQLDHAKQHHLFDSSRYGIWELQTVIFHVLEYAMLTHGNSREVSRKFHADCQDLSGRGFKRFLATVEQECAGIDAGAPAPLQPPTSPLAFGPAPSDPPEDEAHDPSPRLDAASADQTGRPPNGNGAAGAAANGAGEVAR